MSKKLMKFMRDYALIISMITGIVAYFVYVSVPWLHATTQIANQVVSVVQPGLIFLMLLLTFCRIDLRHLHLCRWHLWLLLIQGGSFCALAGVLICMPHSGLRVVLEGAMICLICPTATAAPVIIRKLGGNITYSTTYTILINVVAAILIPWLVPYVHPTAGMDTLKASMIILGKVFPILLLPLVVALTIKKTMPAVHRWLTKWPDAPFYIWTVSLALAMTVTTRSICHSSVNIGTEMALVAVSLGSCVLQFWLGWRIGARYGERVTAGQTLGQKNTVFAIWLGYTFFTPVTAIAGGFYSIWHNIINSYELRITNHESRK